MQARLFKFKRMGCGKLIYEHRCLSYSTEIYRAKYYTELLRNASPSKKREKRKAKAKNTNGA